MGGAIQRDPDRLEKWADRNLKKFHTRQCEVLHPRRNNPRHQCILEDQQLESNFAKKYLGILVDTKVNISQPCALVAKAATSHLGCIRRSLNHTSREVIPPLSSTPVKPPLKKHVWFWDPQYKRDMEPVERVQRRTTKMMTGLELLP